MSAGSPLDDAFAHHTWATLTLIDACSSLTAEQLTTPVPGVYGPILDTLRHFVGNEAFDLGVVQGNPIPQVQADAMSLDDLRSLAATSGNHWLRVVRTPSDPATVFLEVDPDDGFRREAPLGLRLAQALHHAGEHRTQVCTALTYLGLDPPDLSAFRYGMFIGSITESQP